MKLFIAAVLFTLGLAAPVTEIQPRAIAVGGRFSCPGGLTNSSPMCCSTNVLGLLGLDCQPVGKDGCQGSSKPNCCTLGLAGQGVICNEL
ncbi:hydrophobin [Trichoderma sp. TUCIM 5745]